ncbi:MAG: hypothetical protein ACT4P7_20915 [Gemmatimonadaceae bacterium]
MRNVSPADAPTRRTATAAAIVIGAVFVGIGALLAFMFNVRGLALVAGAIATGIVTGVVVRWVALGISEGAGRAFLALVQPSGDSTPYEAEFSQAQAMAAAGDTDGAILAYEAEMRRLPHNVAVRIQSADLHARHDRAERAEVLFLEARRLTSDANQELYCTQRLIDLRLGALRAPARALPELRRIVDRFPGSREAAGARSALARLKDELSHDR